MIVNNRKNLETRKDERLLDYIELLRRENRELHSRVRELEDLLNCAIVKNTELRDQLWDRAVAPCNKSFSLLNK